jgi:hypothetical protein
MTTINSLEALAGKLTEAQRNAILHGKCGLPANQPELSPDCICASVECDRLREMGLARVRERWPNGIILTALGQSLRSHLEKQ